MTFQAIFLKIVKKIILTVSKSYCLYLFPIGTKAIKQLLSEIEENHNGDIHHLVLLSNALSTPIQMVKDGKMYEVFGSHFRGNPIIVSYNSGSTDKCKWEDIQQNKYKSIFHLVANLLNKKVEDIIKEAAKELSKSEKYASVLRPAYFKYIKENKYINSNHEESKGKYTNNTLSDKNSHKIESLIQKLYWGKKNMFRFRKWNKEKTKSLCITT